MAYSNGVRIRQWGTKSDEMKVVHLVRVMKFYYKEGLPIGYVQYVVVYRQPKKWNKGIENCTKKKMQLLASDIYFSAVYDETEWTISIRYTLHIKKLN